jgi:hypothetical protein
MSNIYRDQDQESQERWPEEAVRRGEAQSAVVCTDGWAGRIETPVTVTRRTPKRYECEYKDGRKKLVPKYAVRFTPNTNMRLEERSAAE